MLSWRQATVFWPALGGIGCLMRHQKLKLASPGVSARDDLTIILSCALAARVLVPILALAVYGGDEYLQRSDRVGYLHLASQLAAEASSDRFRHPVMPIICLLAGFGASQVWANRTRTQPQRSTSA